MVERGKHVEHQVVDYVYSRFNVITSYMHRIMSHENQFTALPFAKKN